MNDAQHAVRVNVQMEKGVDIVQFKIFLKFNVFQKFKFCFKKFNGFL